MRLIRKTRAPAALVTYRAQPGARYDGDSGFPAVKQAIRDALVREQESLCCFCEQRVRPTERGMRIAHRVPQSVDKERQLDWANLLAACTGNEGGAQTHCDVSQRNQALTIDPTRDAHIATLRFQPTGTLTSTRSDFQAEIDAVVQLNCDLLRERRQVALDRYLRERFKPDTGSVTRETIERWIEALDRAPPPFVSFLRAWLTRRIRAAP